MNAPSVTSIAKFFRRTTGVSRTARVSLILSLLSFSALNFAMASEPSEYGKFQNRIEAARKSGLRSEVVFDGRAKVSVLDDQSLEALKEIAKDQAEIWGDTILEGDYEADGETTLDRVEKVFDAEGWIGYRITYSERAWFTGNEEGKREPGRISESSFVSSNRQVWLQDSQAYAQFK